MSDLLQCYSVNPHLEAATPDFNTHKRIKEIGTFINGPEISFSGPVGDWVKLTLLGDLMEKAGVAMETTARHVLTVPFDQIDALAQQLNAAAEADGGDSDPEFIDEMIEAVEFVRGTGNVLWIGI